MKNGIEKVEGRNMDEEKMRVDREKGDMKVVNEVKGKSKKQVNLSKWKKKKKSRLKNKKKGKREKKRKKKKFFFQAEDGVRDYVR